MNSDSFTERDVIALLMLLRRDAEKGSPVQEFGDFVAHRERDRGLLQEYVNLVRSALLPNRAGAIGLIPVPKLTSADLHISFNEVLAKLDLAKIDEELANRLIVCIISILEAVQIRTRGRGPLHGFAVGISSTTIFLLAHGTVPGGHIFSFPVLTASNRGYEPSLSMMNVTSLIRCDYVVEAFCSQGRFQIEQRPIPIAPR